MLGAKPMAAAVPKARQAALRTGTSPTTRRQGQHKRAIPFNLRRVLDFSAKASAFLIKKDEHVNTDNPPCTEHNQPPPPGIQPHVRSRHSIAWGPGPQPRKGSSTSSIPFACENHRAFPPPLPIGIAPSDHLVPLLWARELSPRGYKWGKWWISSQPLASTDDLNVALHFFVGHSKRNEVTKIMAQHEHLPRDLVTFNLLLALAARAHWKEAPRLVREIYGQIRLSDYTPDTTTMNTILAFLDGRHDYPAVRRLFAEFQESGIPCNEQTYALLFRLSSRRRDDAWLASLRALWLSGPKAHREVKSYTALLVAYSHRSPKLAAATYFLMQSEGVVGNDRTTVAMMRAALALGKVKEAVVWLRRAGNSPHAYTVFADYLLSKGFFSAAKDIRREVEDIGIEMGASWAALWSRGFTDSLEFKRADEEMERLDVPGPSPPPRTLKERIRRSIRNRNLARAGAVIEAAESEGWSSGHGPLEADHAQAWAILLSAYGRRGYIGTVFSSWERMRASGFKLSDHQAAALIRSCGQANRSSHVISVWGRLKEEGIPQSERIFSSMITALGRCGAVSLLEDFKLEIPEELAASPRVTAVWVAAWARTQKDWPRCLQEAKRYEVDMDPFAWEVIMSSLKIAVEQGELQRTGTIHQQLVEMRNAFFQANRPFDGFKKLPDLLKEVTITSVQDMVDAGPVPRFKGISKWLGSDWNK